jgi:hypothetical protein
MSKKGRKSKTRLSQDEKDDTITQLQSEKRGLLSELKQIQLLHDRERRVIEAEVQRLRETTEQMRADYRAKVHHHPTQRPCANGTNAGSSVPPR